MKKAYKNPEKEEVGFNVSNIKIHSRYQNLDQLQKSPLKIKPQHNLILENAKKQNKQMAKFNKSILSHVITGK